MKVNNFIFPFSLLLVLISALALVCIYIIYPSYGPDTGYYLQISRFLYEGKKIFVDIGSSYTPLSIAMIGLPYLFTAEPALHIHLLMNYSFIALSAVVLYSIMKFLGANKKLSLILAIYFFFVNLLLDSKSIVIEPFSILCQLIAVLIFLRSRFKTSNLFICGVFVGLSFLSKQYGAFVLGAFFINIILNSKSKIKGIAILGVGFLFPLLIIYLYLGFDKITAQNYLMSLLGKNITLDKGSGTGAGRTMVSFFISIGYFLFLHFFIFLKKVRRSVISKENIWIFFALFSSLSVLLFANYFHYFQYISPYVFIVFAVLDGEKKVGEQNKVDSVIMIAAAFLSVVMVVTQYSRTDKNKKVPVDLCGIVPAGSSVFLDGADIYYYYSCNYKSIDFQNVSYTFPGYIKAQNIIKYLDSGEYLVTKKDNYKYYAKFLTKEKVQFFPAQQVYVIKK